MKKLLIGLFSFLLIYLVIWDNEKEDNYILGSSNFGENNVDYIEYNKALEDYNKIKELSNRNNSSISRITYNNYSELKMTVLNEYLNLVDRIAKENNTSPDEVVSIHYLNVEKLQFEDLMIPFLDVDISILDRSTFTYEKNKELDRNYNKIISLDEIPMNRSGKNLYEFLSSKVKENPTTFKYLENTSLDSIKDILQKDPLLSKNTTLYEKILSGESYDEEVIKEIYRKGFMVNDKVIRNNNIDTKYNTENNNYDFEIVSKDNVVVDYPSLKKCIVKEVIKNNLYKELNYISNKSLEYMGYENEDFNHININYSGLKYYNAEVVDSSIKDRRLIEGKLGEVGYKGLFPIFVQSPRLNKISKLNWRFKGSNTTIGKAGCSLLSACSLIQAAGYGEFLIPSKPYKPNVEGLVKSIPNGPITGIDISKLGYKIKMRSTSTDENLEELFKDIESGIPYAVNVRRGNIVGINEKGDTVNTKFTNGGHFILMVNGIRDKNGKRWVEVVQSSYSNAGTKRIDQNNMLFDYDHLVKNKIIRSSSGFPVPAYTIIGGDNLPTPKYLSADYNPSNNFKISFNKNYKKSDSVKIRKKKVIEKVDPTNPISIILRQLGKDFDGILYKTNRLNSNIQILNPYKNLLAIFEYNSEYKDVLLFIDYNNAIRIRNLDKTYSESGFLPQNSIIGVTTDKSDINFVVRLEDDKWGVFSYDKIEVTSD